jgi:hypothetical protein
MAKLVLALLAWGIAATALGLLAAFAVDLVLK